MMASQVTTYFEIGADRPSLTFRHVQLFGRWAVMKGEIASNYGKDAETFDLTEASWDDGNEYAEVVTEDGRIVGALDRALSQVNVAAIWGVNRMEKRAFVNRIRSLFNIDGDLLPELAREEQAAFLNNPVQFFLDATEAQSDAIMREVQARQGGAATQIAALEGSVETEQRANKTAAAKAPRTKKQRPRIDGQREMLLPIKGGAAEGTQESKAPVAGRRAG